MEREFDEMESALSKRFWGDHPLNAQPFSLPRVDVAEYAKEFKITVDLPGMVKEDVELRLHDQDSGDRSLSIIAAHDESKEVGSPDEDEKLVEPTWHMKERVKTTFCRTFRIPDKADCDAISAKMEDGVLLVTVPKKLEEEIKAEDKHRTIQVE